MSKLHIQCKGRFFAQISIGQGSKLTAHLFFEFGGRIRVLSPTFLSYVLMTWIVKREEFCTYHEVTTNQQAKEVIFLTCIWGYQFRNLFETPSSFNKIPLLGQDLFLPHPIQSSIHHLKVCCCFFRPNDIAVKSTLSKQQAKKTPELSKSVVLFFL